MDRLTAEFSSFDQGDRLAASPDFVSVIVTLLPIAPCSRSRHSESGSHEAYLSVLNVHPLSGGAVPAAHDRGVELQPLLANEIPTTMAPPEFSCIQSFDCGLHRTGAPVTPTVLCCSHRLLLHRIHAAQASDALLVKLNRLAIVHRRSGGLQQI